MDNITDEQLMALQTYLQTTSPTLIKSIRFYRNIKHIDVYVRLHPVYYQSEDIVRRSMVGNTEESGVLPKGWSELFVFTFCL